MEGESLGLRRSSRIAPSKPSTAPAIKVEPSSTNKGKGPTSSRTTTRSGKRKVTPPVVPKKRGKEVKDTREKNLSITDDQDEEEEDPKEKLVRKRRGKLIL